jgi:hypothetical protein
VHYRGTVDLSVHAPGSARFPGSNGLGASPYPHTVGAAYDKFLFHGPGFQGIETIVGMSDHGIVARLNSSRPERLGLEESRSWATDPVVLDSALQLVGLWVREHQGSTALPCYIEDYEQYTPFQGMVGCHIEFESTRTAGGRFEATFVDGDGRTVARVQGGQYTAMAGLDERYRDGRRG